MTDDASAEPASMLPDHLLVHFGHEVRTARKARGFTRERFAERCGLSITTIKKLESGHGPQPRLETLLRLSAGLDVALIDLMSCVDPRGNDEGRTKARSANVWLASLGSAQQELVLALIRVLACGETSAGERTFVYAA